MKFASTLTSIAAAACLALGAASALSQSNRSVDLNPKDTRSYSQREQDRGFAEAQKGYEHVQREKQAEAMRDKTHDGFRYKTGKDTSVGGSFDPPGINVRTTTK
ncbi:MAG: hypothetical protein RET84_02640 [Pseudomonadota bacterium]|nr:hypothetical protein [Pseudomonadota bacterium]